MRVCVPITGAYGISAKSCGESKEYFLFSTVNGSIRIKIRENEPYNIITHIDDLKDIFPDKDFTISKLVIYMFFLFRKELFY